MFLRASQYMWEGNFLKYCVTYASEYHKNISALFKHKTRSDSQKILR